jgi:hypothetical protein
MTQRDSKSTLDLQQSPVWAVPGKLSVAGDLLVWSGPRRVGEWPTPDMLRGMLSNFLNLDEGSDQQVLEFARRWGVLGLCKHGLSAGHVHAAAIGPAGAEPPLVRFQYHHCAAVRRSNQYVEPLAVWRSYAAQFNAALRIAAAIRRGQLGDLADWHTLQEWCGGVMRFNTPEDAKHLLAAVVNRWLEMTDVRPRFYWIADRTLFTLTNKMGSALFPALVVQLMVEISQSKGLTRCSGCGDVFALKLGQSARRSRFCPNCQKQNMPARLAARRYREREITDPNRRKRKRLDSAEVEAILSAYQQARKLGPTFYRRQAKKFRVSESTVRKLISRERGNDETKTS